VFSQVKGFRRMFLERVGKTMGQVKVTQNVFGTLSGALGLYLNRLLNASKTQASGAWGSPSTERIQG